MRNLIVTADWHLRDDKPRCRPKDEDWFDVQAKSIYYLYEMAVNRKADVCICGDIFHYDTVSNNLLDMLLSVIFGFENVMTYILPGQHDMKYHNINLAGTSYGILNTIAETRKTTLRKMLDIGKAASFGTCEFIGVDSDVYFTHILCVLNKEHAIMLGGDVISAEEMLFKYPSARVIFAGDNHHGFIYHNENDNRFFCVPGCLIRQSWDLRDYQPGFVFCDLMELNTIDDFEIISNHFDSGKLVNDTYIEEKKESDDSINGFVEQLKGISKKEFTLSFIDNLKKAVEESTLENECVQFINEIIRGVKK